MVSPLAPHYDAAVRAWILLGTGVAAAIMAAALFGACSGGGRVPHSGALPATAATTAPPTPTGSGSSSGQSPGAGPTGAEAVASRLDAGDGLDAGAAEQARDAPAAPSDCRDPVARLLLPDGGVVFNNALTAADAGYVDRTSGILEALGKQAGRFRCCFDPWSRETPGAHGELLLLLELAPDGVVKDASTEAARSTISRPDAVRCVLDVARHTAFPPSPVGKPTLVEYPLEVVGTAG
jgi:hypothetical protein